MLDIMRRYAGNWAVKILLSLVVLVFVFWGFGNLKSNISSNVLTVNGETITLNEYQLAHNDVLREFSKIFKLDSFSQAEFDEIKDFVLKRLINQKLLAQEACSIGLSVTDKELIEHLKLYPIFLSNGVFDIIRYRSELANLGFTPEQFEIYQRELLLMNKYVDLLNKTTKISDLEISNWYNWFNTEVKFLYVFFDPSAYKELSYDIEEVHNYFAQHQQKYITSCVKKIRYVKFDPVNYLEKESINDTSILKYYNSNKDLFSSEKTVDVSHILIKDNSEIETNEKNKKLADKISSMAKMGNDFYELAKIYSECSTGLRGGNLGNIKYDSLVKPFADMAFSLLVNQVSSPVKTEFGWHIIKVNAICESKAYSLIEVKDKIKSILSEEVAAVTAYNRAKEFSENCFNGDDLLDCAELYDVNLVETDWFSDEGPAEFGKYRIPLLSIVSPMKRDQISDIQELGGSYYIIQLMDKVDSKIPLFEDIEHRILTDFELNKQEIMAKMDAESFIKVVNNGKDFREAAKLYQLNLQDTGFFLRSNPSNNIEEKVIDETFNIFKEGEISSRAIKGKEGFYVLYLHKKNIPDLVDDLDTLEVEKDRIAKKLLNKKRVDFLSKLLDELRSDSKIVIEGGYKRI